MKPLQPSHLRIYSCGRSLQMWHPQRDASLVSTLVDESRPELQRWLAWAKPEPLTLPERVQQLQDWSLAGILQENFTWGIWDHTSGVADLVGAVGLHPWGDTWSVGYWVGTPHTRQGHASWAAGAAALLALTEFGLQEVYLYIAQSNHASIGVAERLGAHYSGTLSLQAKTPGESGVVAAYVLTPSDITRLRRITGELESSPETIF